MKTTLNQRRRPEGFTLIELLVVIAIIAILAGLTLPAIGRAKITAQVTKARTDISNIVGAISKFEGDYGRYPASRAARESINDNSCPDFTYGTEDAIRGTLKNKNGVNLPQVANTGNTPPYQNSNSEVMSALLDWEVFKLDGAPTPNAGHALNPKKLPMLTPKETSDIRSAGLGPDGVYRDPWGNPYIITMDLNGDNRCRDAFYKLERVSGAGGSKGLNGLYLPPGPPNRSRFEADKPVMVWSFGPNGQINSDVAANVGVNKDNVLSW